ncbi:MAG: DUF4388 domain-containing protein [Polyangiaceae bacterium]|nr:DUF4388 domain-containing protein [Polyangiaceae bacterium]
MNVDNSDLNGESRPAQLALRFISGKYQGGEYLLNEGIQVVVGRSSELDMVLVEEMVSRRHARIEMVNGVVQVTDLDSTNGTFVNGERVSSGAISLGDRLLVGTSILKLVQVEEIPPGSRQNLQHVATKKDTTKMRSGTFQARMSGNLDEIPLPDLMQLFGTSKKDGTLVLRGSQLGRLHLRQGVIVHADIHGHDDIFPEKAAYRMLDWLDGTFSLEPAVKVPESLNLSAQAYLMEGFRVQDELTKLKESGPQMQDSFGLKSPLDAPLQDLEQAQLEVLQVLINVGDLRAALDRSPKSDLDTMRDAVDLLDRGYIEILSN